MKKYLYVNSYSKPSLLGLHSSIYNVNIVSINIIVNINIVPLKR